MLCLQPLRRVSGPFRQRLAIAAVCCAGGRAPGLDGRCSPAGQALRQQQLGRNLTAAEHMEARMLNPVTATVVQPPSSIAAIKEQRHRGLEATRPSVAAAKRLTRQRSSKRDMHAW